MGPLPTPGTGAQEPVRPSSAAGAAWALDRTAVGGIPYGISVHVALTTLGAVDGNRPPRVTPNINRTHPLSKPPAAGP